VTEVSVVGEVIFSRDQIRRRVAQLARRIARDYGGGDGLGGAPLHLVTVLKGGIFFVADLARALPLPVTLDFLAITSYGPGHASGEVRFTKDLDESIVGRHVLIVEDVVDTGLTLGYIYRNLERRRPASLKVCIFLDRPHRRIVDLPIDYTGFELPDRFVVGYGLDWQGRYRHLGHVAALDPMSLAPALDPFAPAERG
jgi:hypoxanthine phosphoribosyltransferase